MITQLNVTDTVYVIGYDEVLSTTVIESGFDKTGEFVKLHTNGNKYYLKDTLNKILFTDKAKAQATLEHRTCQECIHLPICKAYTKRHPDTHWNDECALVCKQYKDHKKYLYLPFTVGDTVYVITKRTKNSDKEIVKCTVKKMRILNDTNDISYSCEGSYSNNTWYQGNFRTTSIGKKVFTCEGAAKEALNS
jgi:hypothetical protein